jgi:hypothetical protein
LFISALEFTSVAHTDWPTEVLRDLKVYVRDRSSTITKIGWGFTELAKGVTREKASNMRKTIARFSSGLEIDLLEVVKHYGNGILEQAAAGDEGPKFAVGRLHEDLQIIRRNQLVGVARFIFLWWRHSTHTFAIRLKPYRYRGRMLACGMAKRRGVHWTATAIAEDSGIIRIRCEAPGTLRTVFRFGDATCRRSSKMRKRRLVRSTCRVPPMMPPPSGSRMRN